VSRWRKRGAAVQRLREFAKAGAGLVDGIDSPGPVKIMKVVPLGLKMGNGGGKISHE
jgi:hypothetical protein